jgi:UDP-N-acetylmuramoyl-L-alanyl-D-glutamate--2,6-diaminopimelate ligase
LAEVISGLDCRCTAGSLETDVTGIVHDSRQVRPGSLFVCLTGTQTDGRLFVTEALRNGARAVIDHRPLTSTGEETILQVKDTRQALAVCCANWHGNPARQLTLAGITGTDGKTTTSFFLDSILKTSGARTGLIGTVLVRVGDRALPSTHTTPGPERLHELFRLMVEAGASHCTLEVSSHALAQERVFGLAFDAGVFTNLSHEHFEYHANFDEYLAAKSRLFAISRHAVLNKDDPPIYTRLLGVATGQVLDYGFSPDATVRGAWEETREGSILTIYHGRNSASVRLQLPARYNAANALAAAAPTTSAHRGCVCPPRPRPVPA